MVFIAVFQKQNMFKQKIQYACIKFYIVTLKNREA